MDTGAEGPLGHEGVQGPIRVLVVDDDANLLRAYVRILESEGFEVFTAADGIEALNALTEIDPSVVVSDIAMPIMGGIEFLRQVRARSLDLPVLLVTGSPEVQSAMDAVELGAYRYLIKPFDPDVLVNTVRLAAQLRTFAQSRSTSIHPDIGTTRLRSAWPRAMAQVWMAFQPIVSATDQKVFAYEALLRSSDHELQTPDRLLEAARQLERIFELGQLVRSKVADVGRDFPDQTLFVNVAPEELADDQLLDTRSALAQLAGRVVLEITERVALSEVANLRTRVSSLRDMGYRIALDDLGAGYASLNSFAELEPDIVKLDMTLVRNVHLDRTKQRLVGAMTKLCGDMGVPIICEGVETNDERRALLDLGCELMQGYLFAKPGRPFPTPSKF